MAQKKKRKLTKKKVARKKSKTLPWREYVSSENSFKTVYSYENTDTNVNVISREVYKKKNHIVHFPFNKRDGKPKYKNIREIHYINCPKTLPPGFLKNVSTGWGFTKELNPLMYRLIEKYENVEKVVVDRDGETKFNSSKSVVFRLKDLTDARPKIKSMLDVHKTEISGLANGILASMLPSKFKKAARKYTKGQLRNFLDNNDLNESKMSTEDIVALKQLFMTLADSDEMYEREDYLLTKKKVEKAYIEDVLDAYESLMSKGAAAKNLEQRWQEYFSENILYFNFGYVEKFEKEILMGDKSLNIPDFILLNTHGFLDVFEIKTHLTKLLSYDSGRKNFHWAGEATKAIAQAENYIDSLIKNEAELIKNIRDEYEITHFDVIRPQVFILASAKDSLLGVKKITGGKKKKMINDFRRLNDSLKNITFILYDELLDSMNSFLERIEYEISNEEE